MNRIGALLVALMVTGFFTQGCSKKSSDPSSASDASMSGDAGDSGISSEDLGAMGSEADQAMATINQYTTVYFDFDQATLKNSDRENLRMVADAMNVVKNVRLTIEGHCDERGSNEYNLALGERRAQAVKSYLQRLGVDSSRLSTISYGEERPADPASSEAAWSRNRRAELVVNR